MYFCTKSRRQWRRCLCILDISRYWSGIVLELYYHIALFNETQRISFTSMWYHSVTFDLSGAVAFTSEAGSGASLRAAAGAGWEEGAADRWGAVEGDSSRGEGETPEASEGG